MDDIRAQVNMHGGRYAPVMFALFVYFLCRSFAVDNVTTSTVHLSNGMRRIFLPFSKCNKVSPLFIAMVCSCYVAIILCILKPWIPIIRDMGMYDFGGACYALYFSTFGAMGISIIAKDVRTSSSVAGKCGYIVLCLCGVMMIVRGGSVIMYVFLEAIG